MSFIKTKNYRGGCKIDGRKITKNSPIQEITSPKTVYISMTQHIGAPANPTVNIGDTVNKGQLIGEATGVISANVFSSVSGKVVDITDMDNALGQKQKFIVIENDGLNQEIFLPPLEDFEPITLLERIRYAGIVGLGGAGFPTAVKLSPQNRLDTLLINGAECEPYLTCDYRLMIERHEDIYKGIKYIARVLGIKNIIIGIESNKPEAIAIFSEYSDLKVAVLKKIYPMGSEKHLIYSLTGRKVKTGKMPFDVGCCVQNVKTALACYEAIELNKPLTENVITVSGYGISKPCNLKTPFGTPFDDIIEFCGGKSTDTVKIVAGGPMMGKALSSVKQYTKKTDSGLLCLKQDETNLEMPTNCINCGLCAKNCPMRLMPMYIESYALCGDYKNAEKYGALNCLECGLCAYNCPARRMLVQSISNAKVKIKEMKKNER